MHPCLARAGPGDVGIATGSLGAWLHSLKTEIPAGVVSRVETEIKSVELSRESRAATELHTLAAKLMDTSTEQAIIAAAKVIGRAIRPTGACRKATIMTTTTDTLIDGLSPYKVTGETPEQAADNAIRVAREAGEFRIGDAAGFATRNLRITRDAYLGGDNVRGVLVEFDACGMMGSDIKRPTPNGNYAPRRLRLVVQ